MSIKKIFIMKNKFWNITAQYSVGFLCLRAVSFLLLPLYTNLLTTKEAGFIFIVYTLLAFLNTLYSFGMDSALLKFYHSYKSQSIITTSMFFSLMISVLLSLVLLLINPLLLSFFPIIDVFFTSNVSVVLVLILVCDVFSSRALHLVRLLEKPNYFLFVGLVNVVISLFCNIYFIKELSMGFSGALLSLMCVSCIQLFCLIPIIVPNIAIKLLDWELLIKMFKFSVPFVPAAIFFILIEMSDRWMIAWLSSVENVGLYGAGYKIGGVLLLLVKGFNLNWQPYYLKKHKNSNLENFNLIGSSFIICMIFFSVILSVFWPLLFQVKFGSFYLIGESFWSGGIIVPIISISYVFYGIFILQMPSIYLKNKERWVVVFWGIGFLVNFVFNFYLIPIYGFVGAALGTLFTYITMASMLIYKNRLWFPIQYKYKKILMYIFFCLVFYFFSLLAINCFLIVSFASLFFLFLTIYYVYQISR